MEGEFQPSQYLQMCTVTVPTVLGTHCYMETSPLVVLYDVCLGFNQTGPPRYRGHFRGIAGASSLMP